MSLTGGYINDMHWQSYRLNGSLTPEIERELRHQASRAFSNIHSQLGFSVSTSITTVNGITTASTLLQIGKGTPWTEAERKELERRFLKAVPRGNIIGSDGHALHAIDDGHTSFRREMPPTPTTTPISTSVYTPSTLVSATGHRHHRPHHRVSDSDKHVHTHTHVHDPTHTHTHAEGPVRVQADNHDPARGAGGQSHHTSRLGSFTSVFRSKRTTDEPH